MELFYSIYFFIAIANLLVSEFGNFSCAKEKVGILDLELFYFFDGVLRIFLGFFFLVFFPESGKGMCLKFFVGFLTLAWLVVFYFLIFTQKHRHCFEEKDGMIIYSCLLWILAIIAIAFKLIQKIYNGNARDSDSQTPRGYIQIYV
jgi:hypothetical protein